MTVLENLFYGNIIPANRGFAKGEKGRAYQALLCKQTEIMETLDKHLDEQGKNLLEAYYDIQGQAEGIDQKENFLYAFRLGARLMMELLNSYNGALEEDF